MNVALLGRSRLALNSGYALLKAGHTLVLVATAKPADYNDVGYPEFRKLSEMAHAHFWGCASQKIDSAHFFGLSADVAVSVNWPTIISPDVRNVFPHGILNAHAGDLPLYRGNACPNWAILNGANSVGLCVHQMAEDVDAGPVLQRDWFALTPDTYVGEVQTWLEQRIPQLFVRALDDLQRGTTQPELLDLSKGLRCYPRRPEDSRIDWTQSVGQVYRLVRASSRPFGGAFTFLEGKWRVTIWRAQPFIHEGSFLAVPGQILLNKDGDPVIACGDGCLRLTEISLENEPCQEQARYLVGRSVRGRLR